MASICSSVAQTTTFSYPIGNTPAICLTQELRPEQQANILLLGCGDLRNILFTIYADSDIPRHVDFTCCDHQASTIARNVLLLALLLKDDATDNDSLWSIYYSLFLTSQHVSILNSQASELIEVSTSLEVWKTSRYGKTVQFCDEATLADVREVWKSYCILNGTEQDQDHEKQRLKRSMDKARLYKKTKVGDGTIITTATRSAAPLGSNGFRDSAAFAAHFWQLPRTEKSMIENPTLALDVDDSAVLHYGTDPLLGFHLATGYAALTIDSPLRSKSAKGQSSHEKVLGAAKAEFAAWCKVFVQVASKKLVLVRVVASDAIAFAHTLQHCASAEGHSASNWYRDPCHFRPLCLDPLQYSAGPDRAPVAFDVIDTSNLMDHLGSINILVACSPLLLQVPCSALYTETLLRKDVDLQTMAKNILLESFESMSLLLNVFPVEYWTNTSVSSPEESMMDAAIKTMRYNKGKDSESFEGGQMHSRITWKTAMPSSQSIIDRTPVFESSELAELLYKCYLNMFQEEDVGRTFANLKTIGKKQLRQAPTPYHRGSFVALLKFLRSRNLMNWETTLNKVLALIEDDKHLLIGGNYYQELYSCLHLFGVRTVHWIRDPETYASPGEMDILRRSFLRDWTKLPGVFRITIVVPRSKIAFLESSTTRPARNTPGVQCSIRSSQSYLGNAFHNCYAAINISFGKIKPRGQRGTSSYALDIEEDDAAWTGKSPLIASFWLSAPTLLCEPELAQVSFGLKSTPANTALYAKDLGLNLTVHTAQLKSSQVYVTQDPANLSGPSVVCATASTQDPLSVQERGSNTTVHAKFDAMSQLSTLSGRVTFNATALKQALKDQTPVSSIRRNTFTSSILFGKDNRSFDVQFPLPVDHSKTKLRIARSSGYVEVVIPVIRPLAHTTSADFLVPKMLVDRSPVLWNMPRVNLDKMPKLDLSDVSVIQWITTHTSLMWSSRERAMRDAMLDSNLGIGEDNKLNFKESLFSILMQFTGIQLSQQHGPIKVFGLNNKANGGIHVLIFPTALRLDVGSRTVVLDAAIIPLTEKLMMRLHEFLSSLNGVAPGICNVMVDDRELELWKNMLPAYVERCRTWQHKTTCEYKSAGSIPVSTAFGTSPICSCGNGKLDKTSVTGITRWELAFPHAVRAAISPLYGVPFVENLYDDKFIRDMSKKAGAEACEVCAATKAKSGGVLLKCSGCHIAKYCSAECQKVHWKVHRPQCKNTGIDACKVCAATKATSGGPLLKCSGCQAAKYCSTECQKTDWKTHRPQCKKN